MSTEINPEHFKRTPEQVAADQQRLDQEISLTRGRDDQRGGPPAAPPERSDNDSGLLESMLESICGRAAAFENRHRSLPCFQLQADADDEVGIDRCDKADAHKRCEFATVYAICPRMRAADAFDAVVRRIGRESGVEDRERDVLLAAARRAGRVPLLELDALKVVRAVMRRKGTRVPLQNGAEVFSDGAERSGSVSLTGSEVLVVLAGNQGRGKTLAATYAIARLGGLYTRAPQWTRPGEIDVPDAIAAPVLVIDQFGREHFGESKWARSQLEDVIDARHQRRRLTLLVGNITWAAFRERLEDMTVLDRLSGDGVFVLFGGPSLRPGLRAAALQAELQG
jgi:hypothetical protein